MLSHRRMNTSVAQIRILASAFLLSSLASGFSPAATFGGRKFHLSDHCRSTTLAAKINKKLPIEIPPNEFSRTLQPDRVLKTRRGGSGYAVTVSADPTECKALAIRFDLSEIASLSADLQLRPELIGATGGGGVEVEGSCRATVTQRCVRTNEEFQVDLEFPLYCIVRPVLPLAQLLAQNSLDNDNGDDSSRGKGATTKRTNYRPQDRNMDEMDVMELQRMLQLDISDEDDVLMEDEAIYCYDGLMDVGELVAQLFWLKLDPYPKKPGTNPVQRSITG